MRYMDLKVIHIWSMDLGKYRHNYEDFYEKSIYQISINRGTMITTQAGHASLVENLYFLLFLSR